MVNILDCNSAVLLGGVFGFYTGGVFGFHTGGGGGVSMSELVQRLNKVSQWDDLGPFTPHIFIEAANRIEQLEAENKRLVGAIGSTKTHNADLIEVAKAALEYIDSIPEDVSFDSMPGFDRDWAEAAIEGLEP